MSADSKVVYMELPCSATGTWRVITRNGTVHIFDFANGTICRVPGIGSPATMNDRVRPIRTIDACIVGASGRWTMFNDGWQDPNEYYWQTTSTIVTIEPISTGDSESNPVDKR